MTGRQRIDPDRIIDAARGVELRLLDEPAKQPPTRYCSFVAPVIMVWITPTGETTAPVTLEARAISTAGLRARSRQTLAVGSRGAVLLRRSDGEPVVLPARVISCRRTPSGGFTCTLEFEREPAPIRLEDFDATRLPARRARAA